MVQNTSNLNTNFEFMRLKNTKKNSTLPFMVCIFFIQTKSQNFTCFALAHSFTYTDTRYPTPVFSNRFFPPYQCNSLDAITRLTISLYQSVLKRAKLSGERCPRTDNRKEIKENEGYKNIKMHSVYFVYKISLSSMFKSHLSCHFEIMPLKVSQFDVTHTYTYM